MAEGALSPPQPLWTTYRGEGLVTILLFCRCFPLPLLLEYFDVLSVNYSRFFNHRQMSSKRSKSKLSFKVFSANNYSQFASKFPFLKERQIKTKIQKSWRNKFTSGTTKNVGEIEKPKRGNETLVNGGKVGLS